MSNEALEPLLRQLAEKRLGRPLEPAEEQALLERLPSRRANQPAPAAAAATPAPAAKPPMPQLKTRKEAREQIKHFLQLNQQKAYEKMRGILQTIDTQNETTLGMLASEQQKVSGMLDAHEAPAEAQAAGGPGEIQDSTRQALAMIGEQLTGLIRQEIETCFRDYVDVLADRLAERLAAIEVLLLGVGAEPIELPEPAEPIELPGRAKPTELPASDEPDEADEADAVAVHDKPNRASMD